MNNLQPVNTVNSYVVNGYTGAIYYDTFGTYTLYTENKYIIVKDSNSNPVNIAKISFVVSDMCFIDTSRILVASGNIIRIYDIAKKELIAQWTVDNVVTSIGVIDSAIIVVTTDNITFYSRLSYNEYQRVTINSHEKSYVTTSKLVLFSIENTTVYDLLTLNYISFTSVGIPSKIQSYNSNSILLTLENIVLFNLYNGQTDIFLLSNKSNIFVSNQTNTEEHEDTVLFIGLLGVYTDTVREIFRDRFYDTKPKFFKDELGEYRSETGSGPYSVARIGINQLKFIKYIGNSYFSSSHAFVKYVNSSSNRVDTVNYIGDLGAYGTIKYICKDASIIICENNNQLLILRVNNTGTVLENTIDITDKPYTTIVGSSDARQIILLNKPGDQWLLPSIAANLHLFTLDSNNVYLHTNITSSGNIDFEKLGNAREMTLSGDNKKLFIDYRISDEDEDGPASYGIVQWDVGYGNLVNPVINNLGIGPAGISYLFSSYSSKYIVTQDYSAIDGDYLSIFYKENETYSKIASTNSLNLNQSMVNTDIGGDPWLDTLNGALNVDFYKDNELTIATIGGRYAITISLFESTATIKRFIDVRLYDGSNSTSGVVAYI